VAETSSLLNCRTGNGTESSNLSLTAIILKDNRSGRSSARLECPAKAGRPQGQKRYCSGRSSARLECPAKAGRPQGQKRYCSGRSSARLECPAKAGRPQGQKRYCSGRSSARLECLLWEQEAAGSNPAAPTETINLVDGFFMYTKMPTFTRELVFIE
jgi:hypothetical protein